MLSVVIINVIYWHRQSTLDAKIANSDRYHYIEPFNSSGVPPLKAA